MSCSDTAGAGCSTWAAQCIAIIKAADISSGYVDQAGGAMSTLGNTTWGITYDTCQQYCSRSAIPLPTYFDFASFSGAMTNYFLPWIALAAQLPYENSSIRHTIMAFCLAVGSPALVTYSLMITILNRNWVQRQFKPLIKRTTKRPVTERYREYKERIEAALYLLAEGQQVPLRATQVHYWLASLVVLPQNQTWWLDLRDRVKRSRRGYSFSLVAQVLLATFVWIFTIFSSYLAAIGNATTALQIAAATLWIWLIPVTFGWILVGSQNSSGTIQNALEANPAFRAAFNASEPIEDDQRGIEVRSGLTPQPSRRVQTVNGTMDPDPTAINPNANADGNSDSEDCTDSDDNADTAEITLTAKHRHRARIPKTMWMNIRGDERLEGPIYNYARIYTWWSLATLLHKAFNNTVEKLEDEETEWEGPYGPLADNGQKISELCGLQTDTSHQIQAYPQKTGHVAITVVISLVVAIFVQWSTAGSAIIMAYLTPTIGLGCRSGGYALYGLFGTLTLACLVLSTRLSHSAMKKYQSEYDAITANGSDAAVAEGALDNLRHSCVCFAAVVLRAMGKTFAVGNTIFLVMTTLFEYIGYYNTCWCKSCFPNLGHRGWVVLYKTNLDFQRVAQGPWTIGIAASTISSFFLLVFFWAGTRKGSRY